MLTARGTVRMEASSEAVWQVLTREASIRAWLGETPFAGTIVSDWTEGAAVAWEADGAGTYATGTVLESRPGRALSFSVGEGDGEADVMTFGLEPDGSGTRLEVSYGDFDKEHGSDDEHDHEAQVGACKDMQDRVLPAWLAGIAAAATAA